MFEHDERREELIEERLEDAPAARPAAVPGRRTRTEQMEREPRGDVARAAGDPVPQSGGIALPDGLRSRAERALGADLGRVRLHTGARAAASAASMGARAYAVGSDIYFGAGEYTPDSRAGDHLIAHELAHTVQQSGAAAHAQAKLAVSTPGDHLESEADRAADAILAGQPAAVSRGAAPSIARRGQGESEPRPGQSGTPATIIRPNMFVVTGDAPSAQGQVTSSINTGAGRVEVRAPHIAQSVDVAIAPGVQLGDGVWVDVGPIQTVVHSERVGIYRRDGRPDGEVMAEDRAEVTSMRDSGFRVVNGQVVSAFPAPWYGQHYGIADSAPHHAVSWSDDPGIYLRPRMCNDQAVLTETRGNDRFTTSISAKLEAQLIHLRTYQWSVPWAVQIGANGGSTSIRSDAEMRMPSRENGEAIAAANPGRYTRYQNLASAMEATAEELIRDFPDAQREDPAAGAVIAQALFDKNPTFRGTLVVHSTSNTLGGDDIEVTIRGSRTHTIRVSGNDGARLALRWRWADIFTASVRSLGDIAVSARATNTTITSSPRTRSWPYPYPPGSARMTPRDGDGDYELDGMQLVP